MCCAGRKYKLICTLVFRNAKECKEFANYLSVQDYEAKSRVIRRERRLMQVYICMYVCI